MALCRRLCQSKGTNIGLRFAQFRENRTVVSEIEFSSVTAHDHPDVPVFTSKPGHTGSWHALNKSELKMKHVPGRIGESICPRRVVKFYRSQCSVSGNHAYSL